MIWKKINIILFEIPLKENFNELKFHFYICNYNNSNYVQKKKKKNLTQGCSSKHKNWSILQPDEIGPEDMIVNLLLISQLNESDPKGNESDPKDMIINLLLISHNHMKVILKIW